MKRPSRSLVEALLYAYCRHFPLHKGKLRLIRALWRFSDNSGGYIREARLKTGHFTIVCDLSDTIQRQLYFCGTYLIERENLRCWQDVAATANVVFDVGANVGIYSLATLAVRPSAQVHAFEPTPEVAAALRRTAQQNDLAGLQVHQLAVVSQDGFGRLHRFRGEYDDNQGMNFVTTDAGGDEADRVQTVCLDDFCRRNAISQVDLLKLDIQGQEAAALDGAKELLAAGRIGVVFMELNWGDPAGGACPATDAIRLLERAGYRFASPNGRLDWRESGDWLRRLPDVVASRPTHTESVSG